MAEQFVLEAASENGRPIPGRWVAIPSDSFRSWVYSIELAGAADGWHKIGKFDIPVGELVSIEVAAIRSRTNKSNPSQYSMSVSANSGAPSSTYCFIGAMYRCDTGSDYVDGVSLDSIAEFVFVRQVGYGETEADLYVKLNGSATNTLWNITCRDRYFTLDVQANEMSPGDAENTTYATRKEMFG